jgi:hypothetical protein
MNPAEIIGIVVACIAILTAILGGMLWLIRAQVAMQREFKPNGGSSTRDALNRIETDVREIRGKVDDHIEWHMDQR